MSKPVESPNSVLGSRPIGWRSKPLCSRYVVAEFRTVSLPVRDGDAVKRVHWRWALGLFRQDQYEVLGAWPAHDSPAHVVHELHERGIEHLTVVKGLRLGCTSADGDSVPWSMACDAGGENSPTTRGVGPRRLVVSGSTVATAERLQMRITRAIKLRGPFSDEAAAANFLLRALEKADLHFQAVPTACVGRRAPMHSPRFAAPAGGG